MAKYPSSLDSIKKPNSQDPTASNQWIFRCPICGSGGYDAVHKDSSLLMFGSPANILHYKCNGCSVLFTDPKKFTDAKG